MFLEAKTSEEPEICEKCHKIIVDIIVEQTDIIKIPKRTEE